MTQTRFDIRTLLSRQWPVFLAVLLAITLALILDSFQRRLALEQQRSLVIYELGIVRAILDDQTGRAIERSTQIARHLERLDDIQEIDFRSRVNDLLAPELDAFSATWAPNYQRAFTYSTPGMAPAQWTDLFDVSAYGRRLDRMLSTWGVVSEVQTTGEPALVLRFAVENPDVTQAQLSGVLSVEIPFATLLQEAALARRDTQMDIAIGAIGGTGGPEEIVVGSETLRTQDAVFEKVSLPGSTLTLFAVPKGGWQAAAGTNLALRLGLAFLCAMIAALTIWASRSALRRDEATRAKTSAEDRLLGVLANLPGTAFVYTMPPGHVLPSADDKIVFLNKESCHAIWGIEAEVAERDVSALWATGDDAQTIDRFKAEIGEAAQAMRPFFAVWPIRTPAGERKWLEGRGQPTRLDDGSTQWINTIYDVTEQIEHKAELDTHREMIVEAQKQESIGQLTGGVAHDFNNLLAVIMGNLELMRDETTDPEQIKLIDAGVKATKRGADLTRNMLAFARKARLQPVIIDLNTLVRDARNWIGRTLPSNIKIETHLATDIPSIEADPSSVESALLNLIVNARDAMPKGGTLTISTERAQIGAEDLETLQMDLEPGHYVVLAVSDTGHGIPADKLKKIFEPFYSTKPPGRGSGLGLSMIAGFLQQSGGAVRVASEVDRGTTFRLFFPSADHAQTPSDAPKAAPQAAPPQSARILLAEDEADVRSVLVDILERAGHAVVTAGTGRDALDIFERDQSFDLLLTDIVMPGDLQGDGLAREVRRLRADLPVIFMSGYSPDTHLASDQDRLEDARLIKPVQRADLIATITRVLEQRHTRPTVYQD